MVNFWKQKKGQAVIEFLMTYGWMLLVVLIVGALIFSFVDFGSLLPNKLDLSNNTKSLKQSIYRYVMRQNMSVDDIKSAIYEYIYQNLKGKNGYKEYLHLYEEPLINAGLSKYKSQLKLSSILGINRNTLRKKILEHKIDAFDKLPIIHR